MSSPDRNSSNRERAILETLHGWSAAYVHRDFKGLDRFRSDDWTYSGDPSGEIITKFQADELLHKDPTKYLSFEYENLKVRIYGNAAVLTARQVVRFELEGKNDSFHLMWSAVFINSHNQWFAVQSHTSPITEAQS